jgi:hypothetical protein
MQYITHGIAITIVAARRQGSTGSDRRRPPRTSRRRSYARLQTRAPAVQARRLPEGNAADRICGAAQDLGLEFEAIHTEFVGVDATHGRLAQGTPPDAEIPEVQLRVGVRAPTRAPVERFTREIAPLVLNGPPSVTGFAGGRPKPEEIVAFWPALIDRRAVEPVVELVQV